MLSLALSLVNVLAEPIRPIFSRMLPTPLSELPDVLVFPRVLCVDRIDDVSGRVSGKRGFDEKLFIG